MRGYGGTAVGAATAALRDPGQEVREPGPARHDRLLDGLACELAPMVGVWRRLLTEHLPDDDGRCRTCTKGGTGIPGMWWPCALYGLADRARHACLERGERGPTSRPRDEE